MRVKIKPELCELCHEELEELKKNIPTLKVKIKRKNPGRGAEYFTSEEGLEYYKGTNERHAIHTPYEPSVFTEKIAEKLSAYLNTSLRQRGCFLYPKGGGMSWHTNWESPGMRIYFSHCMDGGYFRYLDMETGEIITTEDNVGWTARMFVVSRQPEQYLWHCVGSPNSERLSVGFGPSNIITYRSPSGSDPSIVKMYKR